eukprot:189839-Prorocentrum_minimum.AAC.1
MLQVGERALRLLLGPALPLILAGSAGSNRLMSAKRARLVEDLLPAVVGDGTTHWSATMNSLRGETPTGVPP